MNFQPVFLCNGTTTESLFNDSELFLSWLSLSNHTRMKYMQIATSDKIIIVRKILKRLEVWIMIMEVCRNICLNWTEIEWFTRFQFQSLALFWGLCLFLVWHENCQMKLLKELIQVTQHSFGALDLSRTKSW